MNTIRQSDANAGVVLVIARTFDLQRLAIEKRPARRIPAEGANTKRRVMPIHNLRTNLNDRAELIEIRLIRRPESRAIHDQRLWHFHRRPWAQPNRLRFRGL